MGALPPLLFGLAGEYVLCPLSGAVRTGAAMCPPLMPPDVIGGGGLVEDPEQMQQDDHEDRHTCQPKDDVAQHDALR